MVIDDLAHDFLPSFLEMNPVVNVHYCVVLQWNVASLIDVYLVKNSVDNLVSYFFIVDLFLLNEVLVQLLPSYQAVLLRIDHG